MSIPSSRFAAAVARRRPWLRWLGLALLAGVLLPVGLVWLLIRPLPSLQALTQYEPAPASVILDRSGRQLYEIADPGRGKFTPVPLAQIPPFCRQAVIATEDRRFYEHPGVDVLAIMRAAWTNWRRGETVQGGSTLTQQLARILLLDEKERYERSLRRKLREAVLAWRLERHFSKDELLALYLNHAYFGHYATGMAAAAQAYFGRPVDQLDLAQCALLAGLPQYPAGYNPLEEPTAAKARQKQVLGLMVAAGFIDQEMADAAAAEPLHYASTPFPITAPHFVFYVQQQLEAALGQGRLRQGGLRVLTTLDADWQAEGERVIEKRLQELNKPAADLPQQRRAENAALVALDPATGAVRTMVGSPDYFEAAIAGAVNGALALRQPGSALKPIAYAVALDPVRSAESGRQPFTAATVLPDVPSTFPAKNDQLYEPLNYDLRFHGPVSLRQALANSYNIPAVYTLQSIGLEAFVAQARRQGIRTLGPPAQYGLALVLGGAEVRLLELTAAYGTFVREGRPLQPIAIARIEEADGTLLFAAGLDEPVYNPQGWDLPVLQEWPPVLDARTAYLISDILSDNAARAAAFGLHSPLLLDRPAAVKTGTTTDWRDNWTIGYTPDLLAGVWVGNADNRPIYGASGISGAAPIWHDFMIFAHKSIPPHAFARPPGLVEADVCVPSGLLRTEDCPQSRRELFIAGTEPTRADDQFRPLWIDVRNGLPAGPDTPATARVLRIAWDAPAPFRAWAEEQGMLLWPAEETVAAAATPAPDLPAFMITSPQAQGYYVLDARLPLANQQLPLRIAYRGAAPLVEVQYWLDGRVWATVQAAPWQAWWPLQPGQHTVQAVARAADGRRWQSAVLDFVVSR